MHPHTNHKLPIYVLEPQSVPVQQVSEGVQSGQGHVDSTHSRVPLNLPLSTHIQQLVALG